MNQVMSLATYKCDEVQRHELLVDLPPATPTYQPIGHVDLLDIADDCARDLGFAFGQQHHGLSHDGNRYFGVVELRDSQPNSDFGLMLGLRNSLDKRFPAGLAFGSNVFVCANLCFGGEIVIKRKHTAFILKDLPNLIYAAMEKLASFKFVQEARFETYQQIKLCDRDADHMIINMVRQGVINTSRVEKVVNEWDEPSYDHGDRTIWRLFNAVTEAYKGMNIHELPTRAMGLQAMCDQQAEFIPARIAA